MVINMIEITGILEKIVYRNDENGYTVARFTTEDDSITVTGSALEFKEQMEYVLTGDFTFHKKYGEQFSFQNVKEILPQSENGIINYLTSGAIPYVGKAMAKKIYSKFGEKTLDVIEKSPEQLIMVEGIGKAKLRKILEKLEQDQGLRKVIIFFSEYGIPTSLAMKIYKNYGDNSISVVRENPYKLAEDIRGIGFKKADEIAMKIGDFSQSNLRVKAALKYTLYMATLEGHSFLPIDVLISRTKFLINKTEDELYSEIGALNLDDRFKLENTDPIRCYFAPYLKAENYIAGRIKDMLSFKHEIKNVDELIDEVQDRQKIVLAENQEKAVREATKNGITIITGGPGTGKTTTLKVIIELFELMEKKVFLAAPTGRAAKRMKEATSRDAQTIHKMLELTVSDSEYIDYGYQSEENLDCDVLIVDEVSMVDLNLMENLLNRISINTRLILVGDKDQLPSVGAGNVLSDLINSGIIPVVNLNQIFRQSGESHIIRNAHMVNNGEVPPVTNDGDFFTIDSKEERASLSTIVDLVYKRLPDYYSIDRDNIQVLAPMKKGVCGVNNLNKELQKTLNPKGESIDYNGSIFRIGDRVMQTKNNYNLEYKIESDFYLEKGSGVFNGDIGKIVSVDEEDKKLTVLFDDTKKVEYEYTDLDELTLSYATTIHKSQGSEFEVVVMPIHFAPPILLTRNLLYTAITRAKRLVVLVGNYKYVEQMVKNNRISLRYSSLKEKLQGDVQCLSQDV